MNYRVAQIAHQTPLSKRIVDRIATFIDLPGDREDYVLHRTGAGRGQKSGGAWTWTLDYIGYADRQNARAMAFSIGSQWPASKLDYTPFVVQKSMSNGHDLGTYECVPANMARPEARR